MTHNIENSKNTLTALMMKVQDQAARSADYLAPTNDLLKTTTLDGKPQIVIEANRGVPTKRFDINDTAFGQIATHAGIDTRTARRLQSNYPREFDNLTNAIWQKEPTRRMIRTHSAADPMGSSTDGTARAFVSDKFKTFDNVNLLEACLPQLMDNPAQFQVVSADVSEKPLFLLNYCSL